MRNLAGALGYLMLCFCDMGAEGLIYKNWSAAVRLERSRLRPASKNFD